MPYSIQPEPDPHGSVIAVAGEADVLAAGELKELLGAAAEAGNETVTIDLSEATLVDSRTIGVLVDWTGRLADAGGSLKIVCDNPNVLRLFTRIGLDRTLALFPTREEARTDDA